jgi:predicted PurR-regulated permease PerM
MADPPPADHAPAQTTPGQLRAVAAAAIAFGVLALYVLRGFVPVIIVAAWIAGLVGPTARRLSRGTPTRWAGAAVVAGILVALVLPLALLAVPLAHAILSAVGGLLHGSTGALVQRVLGATQPAPSTPASPQAGLAQLVALLRDALPSAAAFAAGSFRSVASVAVQLVVLLVCAYVFTLRGPSLTALLRRRAPMAPQHFDRLAEEFMAVGRTLLFSQLLTALAQGILSGILYQLLGIGNAVFFAALTALATLVPIGGTALVWVPLSIALAVQRHYRAAVILLLCGVFVISTLDNVLRPLFGRVGGGRTLGPSLLLLGMLGGVAVFGAWGLLLGPLVLALCNTAWALYGDELDARRSVAQ